MAPVCSPCDRLLTARLRLFGHQLQQLSGDRVVSEIKAAGGELLRGIRLFDVYKGTGIPDGKKSLAFALSYQADDRTLADKELDRAHKKVEDRLKHTLKAMIRGKDCN